jgi:hypothetical protein
MTAQAIPTAALTPVSNAVDAERLIVSLTNSMSSLLVMIEEETALVRTGRLREAAVIEHEKGDYARSYVIDMLRLKASKAFAVQASVASLDAFRKRHMVFQEALKTSLTVLATSHAVSEGLIRGVSDEMARKAAPTTYGASGRYMGPAPSASQPIALSRSL